MAGSIYSRLRLELGEIVLCYLEGLVMWENCQMIYWHWSRVIVPR
jgi:hypothetical protein